MVGGDAAPRSSWLLALKKDEDVKGKSGRVKRGNVVAAR